MNQQRSVFEENHNVNEKRVIDGRECQFRPTLNYVERGDDIQFWDKNATKDSTQTIFATVLGIRKDSQELLVSSYTYDGDEERHVRNARDIMRLWSH